MFENSLLPVQLVVDNILNRATEVAFLMVNKLSNVGPKRVVDVRWQPPLANCFKWNTDGSFQLNNFLAGVVGVITNDAGNLVAAFAKNVGYSDSLIAELWGLKDGLKLAQ